jgi:16S rRNA processing protein RimM
VFVECNKHLVPFIENRPLQKMIFLNSFEDVNTEAEADAMMGNDLYLPLKNVTKTFW